MAKAVIQQLAYFVCMANGIRKSRRASGAATIASRLELWSYGAPQTTDPALTAPNGGCVPGARITTSERKWFGRSVDNVPMLTGALGYRHPYLQQWDLNGNDMERRACPGNNGNPILGVWSIPLHSWPLYRDRILETNPASSKIVEMTRVGMNNSFNLNGREIDANARAVGWRLVDTALQQPGPVMSHLFQNPSTLDCVLTFQGSSRTADWLDNVNVVKVDFCGNFRVHRGFKDAMQKMVKAPEWQNSIRPHLGKCRKVNVVGHSLGGATATLFYACASRAPAGQPDWEMMSFTPRTPERLNYKFD